MGGLQITGVSHVIQLAIAPVFLLTGIGTMIGVLANRLGRIVDRSRSLEQSLNTSPDSKANSIRAEMASLSHRMRLIYTAVALSVISALAVGVLIAVAFLDAFLEINLAKLVAALFAGAMLAFIASLVAFLREIFLAVRSARSAMIIDD